MEFLGSLGLTPVSFKLFIACVVLFLIYDWWCHQYFQRRGVPVAYYLPIFGSLPLYRRGLGYRFTEYQKKYGRVFGWYMFRIPFFAITDVDFLKQILVKNFSHFTNRRTGTLIRKPLNRGLLSLKGDDWKNVRSVVTPAFSAVKMKQMTSMINECCDNLVTNFDEAAKKGNPAECKKLYGAFTMDSIAWCGFGLKVDSQKDKEDEFVVNARKAFNPANRRVQLLVNFLPFLTPLFEYLGITTMPIQVTTFFGKVTEEACRLRKEHQAANQTSNDKNIDTLQLLLDAHYETQAIGDDEEGAGPQLKVKGPKRALTIDEVTGQAITFFLAGYETTNTLLGFTSYLLAVNQDCQEKLYSEIQDVAPSRDLVGYDTVSKMTYLDMIISESLRYYPPVSIFLRTCNKDFPYNGVTIENGSLVVIPVYAIHHDEKYWPNPEKFDPERFSAEKKASIQPCTYIPFGFGPRNCIGMRFALLEAKMALVRILQKYRLDACAETQVPLKMNEGIFTAPREGIKLRPVPRQ